MKKATAKSSTTDSRSSRGAAAAPVSGKNARGIASHVTRVKAARSKPTTPIFQEESRTDDISSHLLKNARKTGSLNISARDLVNIPEKVWRINDLDEKEKVSTKNISLDNSTEDKWWEFVDLQKLIVANNYITEIPSEIGVLVSLQVFDAHDNQIKTLSREIGYLENLQKLVLSQNKIIQLPNELYNLKRLCELKLNQNQIEEISEEIRQLSSLKHLDLSNNNLSSLPGDIGFLSFLTHLNISNNKIQELPSDFSGLTGLRSLDASDNCLSNLSNCINHMSHLEILSLKQNKLTKIPQLDDCLNLKELFMQNNLVTEFKSTIFKSTKVQLLDFRNNKIRTFELQLEDLEFVDRFYLNNNDISSLPDDLAKLPSLKQITLEGNPLRGIRLDILQRGTIEIMKYLKGKLRSSEHFSPQGLNFPSSSTPGNVTEEVQVSRTSEEVSCEDLGIDVYKLKNSRALNLTSRNIKILNDSVMSAAAEAAINMIDLSRNLFAQLPVSFADVCPFLTELKLDFNRFTQLPICIGTSCKQLQYLSFQNNQITTLSNEFSELTKLREINLGYNKFAEIPECLYRLAELEIMIAPNNKIKKIEVQKMENLKKLAVLDLQNNDISSVPPELGLLSQLRSLSIEGNSFRVPGYAVLSQGSEAVLRFLRNKLP